MANKGMLVKRDTEVGIGIVVGPNLDKKTDRGYETWVLDYYMQKGDSLTSKLVSVDSSNMKLVSNGGKGWMFNPRDAFTFGGRQFDLNAITDMVENIQRQERILSANHVEGLYSMFLANSADGGIGFFNIAVDESIQVDLDKPVPLLTIPDLEGEMFILPVSWEAIDAAAKARSVLKVLPLTPHETLLAEDRLLEWQGPSAADVEYNRIMNMLDSV